MSLCVLNGLLVAALSFTLPAAHNTLAIHRPASPAMIASNPALQDLVIERRLEMPIDADGKPMVLVASPGETVHAACESFCAEAGFEDAELMAALELALRRRVVRAQGLQKQPEP